jgi:hypothetical protein
VRSGVRIGWGPDGPLGYKVQGSLGPGDLGEIGVTFFARGGRGDLGFVGFGGRCSRVELHKFGRKVHPDSRVIPGVRLLCKAEKKS